MRRLALTACLALLPLFNANAAAPETQALVDELRQLTDKSREQRSADRWLQRALEDMVARYDWPWRNELVFDDFADGDFSSNPRWTVVNGRFWIARDRGLRSRADTRQSTEPAREQRQEPASLESAIFGALLDSAINKGSRSREETPPTRSNSDEPNEIRLDTPISNAFAIEADFSLEDPDGAGRFAFSLLQGSGNYGYRLRLASGRESFAELERVRAGRTTVVDGAKLNTNPGDGGRHQLVWRQAPNGDVAVELDGQSLFSTRDKAFRDGYQQLVLSHWSGDLTLHSIRVSGTD